MKIGANLKSDKFDDINNKYLNKITYCIIVLWLVIGFFSILQIQSLNPFLGTLFILNVIFSIVFITYCILHKYEVIATFKKNNSNMFAVFSLVYLLVIFGNVFVYAFNQREKFVYFWDFSGYWIMTISFAETFFSNLINGLSQLYGSVLNQEYSLVPSVILSLPLKVLGHSFGSYIISIYNFYLIPVCILLILFFAKILIDINQYSFKKLVIISLLIILFPPMISPVLTGYLDSIGLFFVVLLFFVVYHDDFSKFNLKRNLGIIFLLIVFSFTRRWYGYWIVAFFLSLFIVNLIRVFLDKGYTKKDFILFLSNISLVGFGSLLVLVIFFREFLIRNAFNNYADTYSAYKDGAILENLYTLIQYFGVIPMLLMVFGVLVGIKNEKTRYFSVFSSVQAVVIFLAFVRVQSFGIQHYYLFTVTVLFFLIIGSISLASLSRIKWNKITISAVILGIVFSNFIQTYYQHNSSLLNTIKPGLSNFSSYPRVRDDIDQLRNLASYLNELTNDTDKKVYVLASSMVFNDDILRRVNMPEKMDSVSALEPVNHVDKRDGFPNQFLKADIVVVGDPIQYHLRPEDQRVIGILAEEILNGRELGENYRYLKSFALDNGVKAKVYEKIKPYDTQSIDYLKEKFRNIYPEYPNLYNIEYPEPQIK